MKLYFNHPRYALAISYEALTEIGKPGYIQLLEDRETNRLLVRAAEGDAEESYDILDCLYEGKYALAIYADHFTEDLRGRMGWGDGLLSVRPQAIQLTRDGYTGRALLADLNTVEEAKGWPRAILAGCQMREFFEEGENDCGDSGACRN